MSRGPDVGGGQIAGLYDLGDTLGRGHYAVVKLAKHVFTGEQVAVKVIDKVRLDEVSRSHLFQEVRCMKLVQHPNVVRLYEVIDTQTKLYLILELADGGDMYDYIMKHDSGLSEKLARKYFRQIVNAISYCHRLHVVHRDLKPENVVFFETLGMVKLTDFGFSNRFNPGQKLETSCGSLAYSAPEILLGDSYDAPAVDIWSLGVILYMLVVGKAPFQEVNDSETLTKIMDCKYDFPEGVSEPCKELVSKMLIRDPQRRSTLDDIARDSWLISDGPEVDLSEVLPLVSRQHLTEEDHAHIIHKMVAGQIASMEEILEALDINEYNHITATYFLLAERKLRAQRLKSADMAMKEQESKQRSSVVSLDESALMVNSAESELMRPPIPICKDDSSTNSLHNKLQEARLVNRLRTFSIVEEEEEEEEEETVVHSEEDIRDEAQGQGQRSRSGSRSNSRSNSRSGSRSNSRSGSRRGSRASSNSSLKDKALSRDMKLDMKLDLTQLHRLECVRRGSGSLSGSISNQGSTTTSPLCEEVHMPEPPFPQTSNIGIGRGRAKSAATSPATTPPNSLSIMERNSMMNVNSVLAPISKFTPQSSVSSSPTSQNESPSSPLPPILPSSPKTHTLSGGNGQSGSGGLFSPKFKTLPSPNRRLHSVRSSPQLILNEIFEEGESDGENGSIGGIPGSPPPPPPLMSHVGASPTNNRKPCITRSRTTSNSSDLEEEIIDGKKRCIRSNSRSAADENERKMSESSSLGLVNPEHLNSSPSIPSASQSPPDSLHSVPEETTPVESVPILTFTSSPSPTLSRSGRGTPNIPRPLSSHLEDEKESSELLDALSTDALNMDVLSIETTLRESRSLNCILKASGGEGEKSSASFDDPCSDRGQDANSVRDRNGTNESGPSDILNETVNDCIQFGSESLSRTSSSSGSDVSVRKVANSNGFNGSDLCSHIDVNASDDANNIIITGDNITTIYIDEEPLPSSNNNGDNFDERVVIHVTDKGLGQNGLNAREFDKINPIPLIETNDIFLGLGKCSPTVNSDSTKAAPSSKSNFTKLEERYCGKYIDRYSFCGSKQSLSSQTVTPPAPSHSHWPFSFTLRPIHSPVTSQPSLSSALSKSASHIESLKSGPGRGYPQKLRPSATNGALSGSRGYLTDINQNSGGGNKKSRSEKTGQSLAIHGSSKCCSVS